MLVLVTVVFLGYKYFKVREVTTNDRLGQQSYSIKKEVGSTTESSDHRVSARLSYSTPTSGSTEIFQDSSSKIKGHLAAGWTVQKTIKSGSETTLLLLDPSNAFTYPAIYMRIFDHPMNLDDSHVEAWLRNQVEEKTAQRKEKLTDYTQGSPTITNINGQTSISWTSIYTRDGAPWAEYLTRVYSPTGTALFFLNAPQQRILTMIGDFDTVTQSVEIH